MVQREVERIEGEARLSSNPRENFLDEQSDVPGREMALDDVADVLE